MSKNIKFVASEILKQLGNNKFLAMTGAKDLLSDENSLRMTLPKNQSKANRLKITLNDSDLYDIEFTKYTPSKMNLKTFTFTEEKVKVIKTFEGVFADQLQEIFTEVTGFYTSL